MSIESGTEALGFRGLPTVSGRINLLYDNNPMLEYLMYGLNRDAGKIVSMDGEKVRINALEDRLGPAVRRLRAKLEARKAKEKTEL